MRKHYTIKVQAGYLGVLVLLSNALKNIGIHDRKITTFSTGEGMFYNMFLTDEEATMLKLSVSGITISSL